MNDFKYVSSIPLIITKINRNNAVLEFLDIDSAIIKKEMIVSLRRLECCKEKAQLIREINELEELQKTNFHLDRESKISDITNQINEVNIDINSLLDEIEELKKNSLEIFLRINDLNDQIP